MPFQTGSAPDLTDAQIQKIHKKMPRKRRTTSTGYMYEPATMEEARNLRKLTKQAKMMEGARKGVMTQEEYELRLKNIKARRKKKNA